MGLVGVTADTADRLMHALAAVIRDRDTAATVIADLTPPELELLHDISISLSVAVRTERVKRRWPTDSRSHR